MTVENQTKDNKIAELAEIEDEFRKLSEEYNSKLDLLTQLEKKNAKNYMILKQYEDSHN